MNGESSTSKIRSRLVPSWMKRATNSSSKGISSKTASTSATENVESSGHSLPAPGDVPRVHPSDEAVPFTKTASPIAFRRVQQKPAVRSLCGACVNLISVFDEPAKTARDTDKEGASHIKHHENLIDLLECSAICPLCTLIIHAIPYALECCLLRIVREMLHEHLVFIRDQIEAPQEWKLYLENPHSELLLQAKKYSNLTKQYLRRLRSLNIREDIPLPKVLSMIQKDVATNSFQELSPVIRITDQYAIKGQFADFALFLQTDQKGRELRTVASGNLRIATSPSKQVPSYVEIRLA
jgi:hypothetical protein